MTYFVLQLDEQTTKASSFNSNSLSPNLRNGLFIAMHRFRRLYALNSSGLRKTHRCFKIRCERNMLLTVTSTFVWFGRWEGRRGVSTMYENVS